MIDDEIAILVRNSLRAALAGSPKDISAVLAEFDWQDLVYTDEGFAFTALFEEQGYLAADTNALDIAIATVLGLDERAPVLWPLTAHASAQDLGGSGVVFIEGVLLRGQLNASGNILAPVAGGTQMLAVSSIEEVALGGMARGSAWVRARVWGTPTTELGPWHDVEWLARLAIASELVGLARRIIDLAAGQVSVRRQFGRPIASNQAVRFRLAEAYVEMVGAQALIAAAWQDRSPAAAGWAKAAAGSAHDAVAKHAMQVCGAIGLSEEHPLPGLVRRGIALDALLGSASSQQLRIGKELFAHQRNTESSKEAACLAVGRF
jgi:Acyl-CoA dehydrogenase, C-terminal domain